jgi:hypothetical protein
MSKVSLRNAKQYSIGEREKRYQPTKDEQKVAKINA